MTKKQFTKYDAIGAKEIQNTKDIQNISNISNTTNILKGKRPYTRLDPTEPAPDEYRFTARMPGICGVYLNEKAYKDRSTITAEIQKLVEADMKKHPEIIAGLDELNGVKKQ